MARNGEYPVTPESKRRQLGEGLPVFDGRLGIRRCYRGRCIRMFVGRLLRIKVYLTVVVLSKIYLLFFSVAVVVVVEQG
jgi:hypothetical protein